MAESNEFYGYCLVSATITFMMLANGIFKYVVT